MLKKTDFIDTPSWNRGQNVESSFQKLLEGRGVKFRPATMQEQYKHYDYITDTAVQDELVWLEFKNVYGTAGWLASDVDFIAFEREKDFVIIKRIYLYEMASKKCKINDRVTRSTEALYKGYQRTGTKDLISMIKMQDILNLPVQIIEK